MKIGIISDTHDNIWRLDEALSHLQKTDTVLHCGDLISPFIIHRLGENLGEIPVHIVWGNNDGDKRMVSQVTRGYPEINIHGDFAELELDGKDLQGSIVLIDFDSSRNWQLLASLGAKVLQNRSVEMAKKLSVNLVCRSSFNDNEGTLITKEENIMSKIG